MWADLSFAHSDDDALRSKNACIASYLMHKSSDQMKEVEELTQTRAEMAGKEVAHKSEMERVISV